MMEVRPSYPDEFWRLREVMHDAHQESRFRDYDFSEEKLEALYDEQFRSQAVICYYALLDDSLIGFGGFSVSPHFFGHQLVATDFMLYVKPEYRRGTTAIRLIKAYETWANSLNVVEITLGISTGIHVEQTAKFYEKLGYQREAISHRKDGLHYVLLKSQPSTTTASTTAAATRTNAPGAVGSELTEG